MIKNQKHDYFSRHKSFQLRSQFGFTLIEFLVVVVIIGILATLGTLSFIPSMEKSRDGRRKADLANISKALEAYHTDHGSYPDSSEWKILSCGQDGQQMCQWGEAFTDIKGTAYMTSLPKDPGKFSYSYLVDVDEDWYVLLAKLENDNDPSRARTDKGERGIYTLASPKLNNLACGGDGCSYVQYGPANHPELVIEAVGERKDDRLNLDG